LPAIPQHLLLAAGLRPVRSQPVIRLDGVTKRYPNGHVAVDDLSLEVSEGEVCVLVGPSGCGKTTTLRMINRLIELTTGRIEVAGQDIMALDPVELRRHVGYVIQHVGLFPHQTVGDNIATVPRLLGWDKRKTSSRVDELMSLVGLDTGTYRDRYPAQLSGGQQQRVGVARALAADPPVLLMDEPFGAIDPVTRARLQREFLDLQRRVRKTVVLVTHDIDEAVLLGDTIALLEEGGVLAQHGTPDELLTNPSSPFVAGFVGHDRGLKRLAVTGIDPAWLEPPGTNGDGLPRISQSASLREALAQALLSPTGELLVIGDDAEPVGRLGLDRLIEASRP
jgi:osmoprotectant transport system ATP-binding protein